MNIILLVGRSIQDYTTYTTSTGKQYTNLKLSISKGKDTNGDYQSDVITIQIWENNAKFATNYIHKGDMVGVQGRIATSKRVNKETGKNEYITYLVGTSIHKLANNQPKTQETKQSTTQTISQQMQEFASENSLNESDLPW